MTLKEDCFGCGKSTTRVVKGMPVCKKCSQEKQEIEK